MKRKVALLTVLVIAITVIGVTTLMSCGGGEKGLTGRYQLTSLVVDGEELFNEFKDAGMDMDDMYIEFSSGNKYKVSAMDEVDEGTYEMKGKKLTFDVAMEGTVDGKKITLEETLEDGTIVRSVFEKK